MPLPSDAQTPWPPAETEVSSRLYKKWSAWWSGDLDQLAQAYSTTVGYDGDPLTAGTNRAPLVGLRSRMFHGAPAAKGALASAKLHIPLASDIAMTSADLLFGEPPVLVVAADKQERPKPGNAADNADDDPETAPDTVTKADSDRPRKLKRPTGAKSPTQDRLDFYMANGLQATLLEAAEIAAAFGGVYLRVGWDAEIADHPLFDAIAPDAAVPEFRSGRLVAVTFHRVLRDPGNARGKTSGKTWRHLERHEKGRILHGLYASGDDKTLGEKRPLGEHPDTAPFAALVGAGDSVDTGATGLCVEYVPNMLPNRRLRGSQLGRSDFDGIETVMDALDECWTSWMRDIRIGKGRILVPEVYLEGQGRGQGAVFDLEQEVFQVVNALPGGGANGGLAMSNVQFEIRVAEHQQTSAALTEHAVRDAGYSAQTFGMQGDGSQATATEVNARQSRSFMTRAKKLNYWRPPLARLTRTALEIDVRQFKPAGVSAVLPDVEWPDGIAVDPQTLAQTLQLLRGANAASTRTLVELLHPDWDRGRVDDEVTAIREEMAPPQPAGAELLDAPGTAIAGKPKPDPGEQEPGKPPAAAASGSGDTPTGTAAASTVLPGRRTPPRRPAGKATR